MRRAPLVIPVIAGLMSAPAGAITGQAPPASGAVARSIVMIVDARGDLCTGTAIARDLVLTAAHCVGGGRVYRVRVYQTGDTRSIRAVAAHPRFSMASYAASRATADVAVLRLEAPLPETIVPAVLAPARRVAVGETLLIAGYGVTEAGTPRGLGVPRAVSLVVTGQPGSLQIRLVDPVTRDKISGRGGCTGDSGGPAFEAGGGAVIGVIGWSTAANGQEGCGGLTGITPLLAYRDWIVGTARKFGSTLP